MAKELRHDQIDPDPNQPRKSFDEAKLLELAGDIAVNGVLSAILVRPTTNGRYMIIFGERRWRAAGLIGLEMMPVDIRDGVNDQVALAWQMSENTKRDDMHPLEEADGYRVMHERDKRDIDEIIGLTGKTRAYIYAAMKLCALSAEPRKAFLAGKLDKSRALLIARLPGSVQAKALAAIADRDLSYRQIRDIIQMDFMLRLAAAPFDRRDATLDPAAGSCTACPKRTGNQAEIFADVVADKVGGGADICTDVTCYKKKLSANVARLKASADARGVAVIEGDEASNAGNPYFDKRYVALDDCALNVGDGRKTYRQLLGKRADETVSAIAVVRDGTLVRELAGRKDIEALLEEVGAVKPEPKKEKPAREPAETRQEPRVEPAKASVAVELSDRARRLLQDAIDHGLCEVQAAALGVYMLHLETALAADARALAEMAS